MLKKFLKLGLIILLLFSLISIPVSAQSTQKEAIVVDGREIFQVEGYDSFPAKSRADWTNAQIQDVIKSEEEPQIKIEQRNQSPTIILNDRYLLTVTEKDTLPNLTPQQQANIWGERIRKSVIEAQSERSESYIIWRLIFTLIGIIWAIGFHWLLGRIWRKSYRFWLKLLRLEETESSASEYRALRLFLNATLLLARIGTWILVVLYITNLFPLTRVWNYRLRTSLVDGFTSPLLEIGAKSYSIIDFVILIGLLVILFFAANTFSNLLKTKILSFTQINRGVQEAITFVAKYTIFIVSTIVLLQVWGFDLSSLTIFASAIGVAIGFGFQDIAKNFGSGLVLLFERPIKVGDFVEVGSYMGSVEHIGARSTLIRTLDQISIIVPNSRFLEEEVINWSHHNPVSRLHLPVGVSYNSDVKIVRRALLEAVKDHGNVLKSPTPQVLFKGFGDSAIDFELLVYILDPSKQMIIKSDLYFAIEASLKKYKIEIPFPQQDLHFKSGKLPLQLSSELEKNLNTILKRQ